MHSARVPASYVLGGDIRATPSPSGFGCCVCSAVERLQGMDVCRTGGSQSRVIAVYTLNLRGNETGLRGRVLSGRSLSSVGGAGNPSPPHFGIRALRLLSQAPPCRPPHPAWRPGVSGPQGSPGAPSLKPASGTCQGEFCASPVPGVRRDPGRCARGAGCQWVAVGGGGLGPSGGSSSCPSCGHRRSSVLLCTHSRARLSGPPFKRTALAQQINFGGKNGPHLPAHLFR